MVIASRLVGWLVGCFVAALLSVHISNRHEGCDLELCYPICRDLNFVRIPQCDTILKGFPDSYVYWCMYVCVRVHH